MPPRPMDMYSVSQKGIRVNNIPIKQVTVSTPLQNSIDADTEPTPVENLDMQENGYFDGGGTITLNNTNANQLLPAFNAKYQMGLKDIQYFELEKFFIGTIPISYDNNNLTGASEKEIKLILDGMGYNSLDEVPNSGNITNSNGNTIKTNNQTPVGTSNLITEGIYSKKNGAVIKFKRGDEIIVDKVDLVSIADKEVYDKVRKKIKQLLQKFEEYAYNQMVGSSTFLSDNITQPELHNFGTINNFENVFNVNYPLTPKLINKFLIFMNSNETKLSFNFFDFDNFGYAVRMGFSKQTVMDILSERVRKYNEVINSEAINQLLQIYENPTEEKLTNWANTHGNKFSFILEIVNDYNYNI